MVGMNKKKAKSTVRKGDVEGKRERTDVWSGEEENSRGVQRSDSSDKQRQRLLSCLIACCVGQKKKKNSWKLMLLAA